MLTKHSGLELETKYQQDYKIFLPTAQCEVGPDLINGIKTCWRSSQLFAEGRLLAWLTLKIMKYFLNKLN